MAMAAQPFGQFGGATAVATAPTMPQTTTRVHEPAPQMSSSPRTYRRKKSKAPLIMVVLLIGGVAGLYFTGKLDRFIKRGSAVAKGGAAAGTKTPPTTPPAATGAATSTPAATEMAKVDPAKANDAAKKAAEATAALSAPEDPREKIVPIKDPVWESPTKGAPLEPKYLISGAQAIIALRPAQLMKNPESEKLLDSSVTGNLGAWIREGLPKELGLPLEKLDQVVISVLDNGAEAPKLAYRVQTTDPVAFEALQAAWGNPGQQMAGDKTFYEKDGVSYYGSPSGGQKLFVVGPSDVMKDVIESDGAATSLPLDIEVMLKQTDADRTITAIFVPRTILAPGKPVFTGTAKLYPEQLEKFLSDPDGSGELPKSVLASLNLKDALFLELRIYDQFTSSANETRSIAYEGKLKQITKQIKTLLLSFPLSKYSQPILVDFEDRLRQMLAMLRVGSAEKQIVARAYLPATAASNLAMSTYLATIEHPEGGFSPDGDKGQPIKPVEAVASGPEGKLQKKTSLAFERNTLEYSVNTLGDDIGLPIKLHLASMSIEGITQNQSFGLDETDKPALSILKTILLKASPAGKLVYCITKDAAGEDIVMVCTRVGAASNKWTIPADMK